MMTVEILNDLLATENARHETNIRHGYTQFTVPGQLYHAVTRDIIDRSVENGVGRLLVGNPKRIREDEDGNPRNWSRHGNLDLHSWPFDGVYKQLKYKSTRAGITVEAVSERDTSKTCCNCGRVIQANRVECSLYACRRYGMVTNRDVNSAENIRVKPHSVLYC